jgi:hypothetical protein
LQICEIISNIKYLGGPVKTKTENILGGESGAQIGLVANQFKKKIDMQESLSENEPVSEF